MKLLRIIKSHYQPITDTFITPQFGYNQTFIITSRISIAALTSVNVWIDIIIEWISQYLVYFIQNRAVLGFSKMKLFWFCLIFTLAGKCQFVMFRDTFDTWYFIWSIVHGTCGEDYILVGNVESVSYAFANAWPCYVAIRDESSSRNLYFHAANHESMCNFAEKCRDRGFPVKMRAQIDSGSNIIVTIEYANTDAKYW